MMIVCRYRHLLMLFYFFKQKTAYELRISDWSSDVCSSDLSGPQPVRRHAGLRRSARHGRRNRNTMTQAAAAPTDTQLTRRIIPCLDVTAGRVVKGINFVDLVDAGDPIEIAQRYNEPDRKSTRLNPSH